VPAARRVALVTLGCARNEVDSEELAGRLDGAGWELVDEQEGADVVVVNTCGFVESAKKDSIDTLLGAADTGRRSWRSGASPSGTASSSPSSCPRPTPCSASTPTRPCRVAGRRARRRAAREPHARRPPQAPADQPGRARPGGGAGRIDIGLPGHAGGPAVVRRRLDDSPVAPLKLASGCDRRCSFCAIPSFRGAFVSRRPSDVLAEARWLADHGVRELVLVSENSTSYGKDLGDLRLLETLLPELAAVDGIERVGCPTCSPPRCARAWSRCSPAPRRRAVLRHELPALLGVGAAAHAPLRRHRPLPRPARADPRRRPDRAGRSNVIVGFPGETEADVASSSASSAPPGSTRRRVRLLRRGRHEAEHLPDHLPQDVVDERVARLSALVEELTSQRAEERAGELADVLVDAVVDGVVEGRTSGQAPEVDGSTTLVGAGVAALRVGDLVRARVVGSEGVDLVAELVEVVRASDDRPSSRKVAVSA
jgi:tRNA A37 methylthiotransferase MiaB